MSDSGGRLPPGQIETTRFPVVGERRPSSELADGRSWRMGIEGLVAHPFSIELARFMDTAKREVRFDIHCVTSWTRFDSVFTGAPLSEFLEKAEILPQAKFVSFEAYSVRGHHTSLPLDVALTNSWLVHSIDGLALPVEHGGPVRVVTPGRYFYKSLKWVKRVVVLENDRLGWWETNSSYHNNADPWSGKERFTTGSLRPEQVLRFLTADSYAKYRGRVMIGLDLKGWKPPKDLRRLYLKHCDLRSVDLAGADLREANLSLSDLRGAKLTKADLTGSDLEGANFSGADLTDANLSHTALSAARFFDETGHAKLSGTILTGSWGLTERQQAYVEGASGAIEG